MTPSPEAPRLTRTLLSITFFSRYSLDRARHAEVQAALVARDALDAA